MKNLITYLLISFICFSAYAVNITEGTTLYLTPHSEWKSDNARFAAYFFGGSGAAWINMTAVQGETDLYEVTAANTHTNVIFCRMNPNTTQNNWDAAYWGGKTGDLVYDGSKNRYTVTSNPWNNNGASGSWSIYTPVIIEPSVTLNILSSGFVDEQITFNAAAKNVSSPVYTYSVKVPGSESYVSTASPYQPTATGTYTFKVEVAETGAEATILAEDVKTVEVKAVPAPFTVKVKKPESWTTVSFYNWNDDVAGNFATPTPEGDWYSYTFSRTEVINLIFVNGSDWPQDADQWTKMGNQTVNVENVNTDVCYQIGDQDEPSTGDWGKRVVTAVSCTEPLEPTVALTITDKVFVDEQITFNATSENVTSPVYTYSVKVPGSESYVSTASPYQPTVTGTYTFKVEVAETGAEATILAEDVKTIDVKTVPAPFTVKVKKPESWTTVSFYNWSDDVTGNFATPTPGGDWYTYTFSRTEVINLIFVNGSDWPQDADQWTKMGNQTVNVENVNTDVCYQIGDQDEPSTGDWGKRVVTAISCTEPLEPTVALTITDKVFVDEQITFSATSENVTSPVYTYSVKVPGSESYVSTASPYQPTVTGTYTFKVEVAETGAEATILAEDVKTVEVKTVPAPFTVKVKKPESWTTVSFYNWSDDVTGNFAASTLAGDWYSYTFSRTEVINLIFVNGSDWPQDADQWTKMGNQTVNVENVNTDVCYQIGDQDEPSTGDWGKRVVTAVSCTEPLEPTVALTIADKVFVDEQITFNATSENVTSPVYTYSVKVPGSESYVSTASPYQPTATGTYNFKVEVAETGAEATILAEDVKTVEVKTVPAPFTVKVKKPESWTTVSFYNWSDDVTGNFATPTLAGDWYTYTFSRTEVINLIFVNGSDWPQDADQWTKMGNQTVNVENVNTDVCYQIGDQDEPSTGDWGKRVVTAVSCTEPLEPTVALTIVDNVFVNEQITFSATSENVNSPVYTYSVKLPNSGSFVTASSPYQPTVTGTYTFKVEVAESSSPSSALAEDVKTVEVKAVPVVTLTIADNVFVNEQITFSATSANVISPVYTYSVKLPNSGSFVTVTSPYQPTVTGTYTFKVEVAENSSPSSALAEDVKTVEVKAVPVVTLTIADNVFVNEQITFSATSANVTSPVYAYSVKLPNSGSFVTVTSPYQPTVTGTYTFKVEVAESSLPTSTLAEDVKTVLVKDISIGLSQTGKNIFVTTENNVIKVLFEDYAQIELYSITGQLLYAGKAEKEFTYSVTSGIYLIRVNEITHKILVR